MDVGLHYWWPHGSAEAQYGQAFVEPASVATMVVSADAIEGTYDVQTAVSVSS